MRRLARALPLAVGLATLGVSPGLTRAEAPQADAEAPEEAPDTPEAPLEAAPPQAIPSDGGGKSGDLEVKRVDPPATPAAPPPASAMFDVSQTPWGPGRKTSGEAFRTLATPLPEGPFRWAWDGFQLALGGQYFVRGEARNNADFASSLGDSSQHIDQRARLTVRGSVKERVGFLLEYQDVRAWGAEPNTITTTPNTGLHQGFVDLKATDWLDLRVGRQELSYGEDRLIGSLDWAQTARAFNGVFARVTASKELTIDAFGMMLRPPGYLTADAGDRFQVSGSYFTGLSSRVRLGQVGFDVYALGLLEDPSTVQTGLVRDNNIVTLGARAFVNLGPLSLLGEGAYQTGRRGPNADTVRAGAFAGRATYKLDVFGAPYVLAEVSGATGDGDPTDGVSTTFHQLFPTAHLHLGFIDYVAWQNVVAFRGTVGWRPFGAHVWLDVHKFDMWERSGIWYAANGMVFLGADPMRTSRDMGTEVDLSFTVPLFDNVSLAGAFAVFLPGAAAQPAEGSSVGKGSDPSTWGFLYVRSQF